MTDWDKLWENAPNMMYTDFQQFFDKVKAEGDRLSDKAKMFDLCNSRLNELALRQTRILEILDKKESESWKIRQIHEST